MGNCRWLLYLVVIDLAMREVSSMNEQSRGRNDSSKTTENVPSFALNTNSEGKKKPHDEPVPRERDQMLFSRPESLTAAEIPANLTSSNGSVALVADSAASTSANTATKLSHSKRHLRRAKLYRKESRTKSRSSIKSNVASGNVIPFSTRHSVLPSLDLLRNSDHNSDGIKLVESTSRTSSGTKTRTIASHNDSIPTTSSRMTSGSENWDNSSISSDSGSIVDEKSSSVELMAFTFESVEEVHQPTLLNDLEKRLKNLIQSSSSIAMGRSSSTPMTTPSDDKFNFTADPINERIDRAQSIQTVKSGFENDATIYSVHTEKSRNGEQRENDEVSTSMRRDPGDNMKDDSVILVSVASESPASRKSMNGSSPERKSDNASNATNFKRNLNHSRIDADGYSWVSIDDSSNRISLTDVADTLKNVASGESRGFYPYSTSTVSKDNDYAESPKHSRSLTPGPGIAHNSREPRPFMSSEPELKLSGHYQALPPVSKFDHPLKGAIPLNLEAMAEYRIKNDLGVEDSGLSGPSISRDSSHKKRSSEVKDPSRKSEPSKLVLDLDTQSSQCSSRSSTERSSRIRRRDDEHPFYQRPSSDVTLAIRGNSVPEAEQCLTMESIASPVIPSNPEENDVEVTITANKSHGEEAEDTKSFRSALEENQGGQSLLSPSIIVFENFEPVILESLASEESLVPLEPEPITSGHFFAAFPDLEEHCNTSSFNVFIPSVNSRESIVAKAVSEEEPSLFHRAEGQLIRSSTEDSIYIMEGFGFFKDNPDESAEIEDELDRRRDAPFDYAETEVFPGYPQLNDHPASGLKLIDQIDFEAELPVKQEHLIADDFRWEGNPGDQNYDPWWSNDGSKRREGQAVEKGDLDQRTVFIFSGFATPKDVPVVQTLENNVLPQITDPENNNYRIVLLPTVYIFIGISIVVVVGCSIWCSRHSMKRQSKLPKLTYFIQQRQGATETV